MVCFYLTIIYEFCPKQKEKSSDLKSSRMGNDRNVYSFREKKPDCILFFFFFSFLSSPMPIFSGHFCSCENFPINQIPISALLHSSHLDAKGILWAIG